MPRPRLRRRIGWRCRFTHLTPIGPGVIHLEETKLTHGEVEAIRLKDFKGFDQAKAAKEMKISQPTFHRLILSARKKIADAFVNNKIIKIEGGTYEMVEPIRSVRGRGIGRGQGPGRGFGLGRGSGVGPGGFCICPKCGNRQPKVIGKPCTTVKCKKCGTLMIRE
jgi:predicted DNA-binding protein (UPF0251 family)